MPLISGNPPGSAKSPAGLERQPPNVPVILYSFPALQQETDTRRRTETRAETQGRARDSSAVLRSLRETVSSSVHQGKRMCSREMLGNGMGDKGIRNGGGQPALVLFHPCPSDGRARISRELGGSAAPAASPSRIAALAIGLNLSRLAGAAAGLWLVRIRGFGPAAGTRW